MKTIFRFSVLFVMALWLSVCLQAQADPATVDGTTTTAQEAVSPTGPAPEASADLVLPGAPKAPSKASNSVPTVDTTGIAKGPFLEEPLTLTKLLSWYDALYGALIIIWGFVYRSLGKPLERIPKALVVAAGGGVLAAAFVLAGWSSVLPLLFAFLGAIGVYDLFIKPTQRLFKR